MALIEINKNPSKKELRWFGLLLLAFCGLVGAILLWRGHELGTARVIWMVGAGLALVYYVIPPLRRWMFIGWMTVAFPIGWTISHLILGVAFYLVFTPIALLMRLLGRDSLCRRWKPDCDSYWTRHEAVTDPARYFKQY